MVRKLPKCWGAKSPKYRPPAGETRARGLAGRRFSLRRRKPREARRGALPAGVALDQVAERPAGLPDAGAGVAVDGARAAAVVALDGPDGDERQPVGAGEPRS